LVLGSSPGGPIQIYSMLNCIRCGKPYDGYPSDGTKYCSRECRIDQKIAICKCGKEFVTWGAKKAPKTCGDIKCRKSRSLSQDIKDKLSNSRLSSRSKQHGRKHQQLAVRSGSVYTIVCKYCQKPFGSHTYNRAVCDHCKEKNSGGYRFTYEECRAGAVKSISSNRISHVESNLSRILPLGCIRNDRSLLGGLEIDYLYDKLAVEYHGIWHYSNFHDHYDSTKQRDRRKAQLLADIGYMHYIIGWALSSKPTNEFFSHHSYFVSQLFETISPFKFLYDRGKFLTEYSQLRKTTGKYGYICNNISNWFHSYRWFQHTSTHEMNAVECWAAQKDSIISNRQKYSRLTSVDLRRYFLLFDYTPSSFSDILAKNLALQINGDLIVDPFAGYGNRLLGVCSAGKTYQGYDINLNTVNANVLIIKELDLSASCVRKDSSTLIDVACDGLVTCPPYCSKDNYGSKSKLDYYDMIRDTFKAFKIRDKGFVIVKPSLVDIDKFKAALGKIKSEYEINWGGLNRRSIHKVFVI
jgi:hypothetical protein